MREAHIRLQVPAHSELMWILSCTASVGYLSRMTQWKVENPDSSWYPALFTYMNLQSKLSLSENSSFLDEKAKASLKLGLFAYPVLQAADILVYRFVVPRTPDDALIQSVLPFLPHAFPSNTPNIRATHVPVGEDQRQHLEFARECATNFNHTFGQHLVLPETIICT